MNRRKWAYVSIVSLSLLVSQNLVAACDTTDLLTRVNGAMRAGVIDDTLLTIDVRKRFVVAYLDSCPHLKNKLNEEQLTELLEAMTAGWQLGKVDWDTSVREHYFQLKKVGLLPLNLNLIDWTAKAIETNFGGKCEAEEIASRFLTIGECPVSAAKGIPNFRYNWLHTCVTSVEMRESKYIQFLDYCPQTKFSWEVLRELMIAAKSSSGMGEIVAMEGSIPRVIEEGRKREYPKFQEHLTKVVASIMTQWNNRALVRGSF